MSSMPQSGSAGEQRGFEQADPGGGQQGAGQAGQAGPAGGGQQWEGAGAQGAGPQGAGGQWEGSQATQQQWAGHPGGRDRSPVPREATRVTFRRIVQYIIDSFLAGIIPAIVWWAVGDRGSGVMHTIGWIIAAAVWVAIMLWYWIARPLQTGGQTFAMRWLGVRIISKDGGPASALQLFVRWILLILDDLVAGLVGLVTILLSRHRQRIGDHVAGTLVVRADWEPGPVQRATATAAQPAAEPAGHGFRR